MSQVAVIIPCHNDGLLVEEAVVSVREQENTEVELVIIDDASTDSTTITRLAALERSGVRVLRLERNLGPGPARSIGLRHTSAPFVYPLDADDVLVPGALTAMIGTLNRHPTAGFTWGDYAVFGSMRGRYKSPSRPLPWTLTYVNPYPVCSMFHRDVLVRAGGWQLAQGYEDWDLWMTLVEMGVVGIPTDRVVYRRRIHGGHRRLTVDRRRHKALYATLQERHSELFAQRNDLRHEEMPAAWKRLAYPVLFGSRSIVPLPVERLMLHAMLRLGGGLPTW